VTISEIYKLNVLMLPKNQPISSSMLLLRPFLSLIQAGSEIDLRLWGNQCRQAKEKSLF
jgi:hypothetical protein